MLPRSPPGAAYVLRFFFSSRRRHTRLQGDWSSDVCSSDLSHIQVSDPVRVSREAPDCLCRRQGTESIPHLKTYGPLALRSEERRVGKECRSRWSPYH